MAAPALMMWLYLVLPAAPNATTGYLLYYQGAFTSDQACAAAGEKALSTPHREKFSQFVCVQQPSR